MPSKTGAWSERLDAVRHILATEAIRTQTELLERLQVRGFLVTQSSVSRDLQELGVAKIDGRYLPREAILRGALPAEIDGIEEAAGSIRGIRPAGVNILVVHTPPGRASTVALAIDEAQWPEIVGTVAGDDTLFIATSGKRAQANVVARLNRIVKETSRV